MKRLALPLLLLAMAACAPVSVPAGAPAPAPPPSRSAPPAESAPAASVSGHDASTASALSRSIVQQVDAARARAGSQALLLDPAPQKSARRYAVALISRDEP